MRINPALQVTQTLAPYALLLSFKNPILTLASVHSSLSSSIFLSQTFVLSAIDPSPLFVRHFLLDKFCYKCILQWTKVVSRKESRRPSSVKCPLCKTENFSLIYGYDGSSFQRHYVNQGFEDSSFFSKAHKYRLQCYYTEPGILNDSINVSRYWKLRKYIQPNRWLESWLRREVQALLQEEDTEVILYHILGTVNSFFSRDEHSRQTKTSEMKQEEFKDVVSNAARPFLTAKTDRFVKELELFLASGLNIEAYDDVYLQRMGWNTPKTTEAAGESVEHNPVVPYLYIFDADSEND